VRVEGRRERGQREIGGERERERGRERGRESMKVREEEREK
jgi:hypothetical protein